MDDLIASFILGIVEGLTEFLPVSSTGHLILVNEFIGFTGAFAKTFDIVIQTGAILAVLAYYRGVLLPLRKEDSAKALGIWKKAAVAVLPALVIGALFGTKLQAALFNPVVVAGALIVGGIALIALDRLKTKAKFSDIASMGYGTAFAIGLFQCLSFVPGTSRSAATIVGALLLGVARPAAVEFSFFLAVPTLAAAGAYSLAKSGVSFSSHELVLLGVGFAVSFAVAYAAIAGFVKYVTTRGFTPFGLYRIIVGAAVLAYFLR